MKLVYKSLLLLSLAAFSQAGAQNNFFSDAPESSMKMSGQKRTIVPNKFRSLNLDTVQLKQFLKNAPLEFTDAARTAAPTLAIPMPDGSINHFSIVESPIMEPGLAAKFPNIKTYSGQGIEDRTATIKIDWTDFGFHAMIYSPLYPTISIDPYARETKTGYISYSKVDLTPKSFKEEGVEISQDYINNQVNQQRTQAGFCFGGTLRTYRLAIACTGEYAAAVGGTNASLLHSAIVTTVNRVDGVYEKEVAIRLVLVANNNIIEYLTASSDPFTGNNNANTLISESQSVITNNIGTANFDIGHTFSTGGGGLAGLGVVCMSTQKARGITGSPAPTGDAYDIDYVAHEVGHQFGGNHTFNAITGNCGGNRNAGTAVEPGSGITIMGYAGICDVTNDLASNSIPYFHATSQSEIGTYSNNSTGNTCAVATATGNSAPSVNAGLDYTVPANTPFILTGSATDANGDVLTYSWEEIDPGTSSGDWNSGSKPFFRSFAPTVSASRSFPKMSSVAGGTNVIGEVLPVSAQTLNFRLTARDNRNGGGGVCSDEMVLNVVSSSGFAVSSQWGGDNWVADGSTTAAISWSVSGTDVAPISCTSVDILFSADGGLTFPYTLLSNTPNDGSQAVVIPAVATTKGRVMVKARGNVFYNMNTANINVTIASALSANCIAEGALISPPNPVSSYAGSPTLNLNLSTQYNAAITSVSGTLESTDPASTAVFLNLSNSGCIGSTNVYKYDSYPFTVSQAGTYTFTFTTAAAYQNMVANLYSTSFNGASPCTNFLKSSGTYPGTGTTVTLTSNVSAVLAVGTTYILTVGSFSGTAPTLPATYTLNIATPSGASVISTSGYTNPGAAYGYSYVVVDNATGIIKAINSTANLTNSTTYPSGTSYSVYGVSYKSSQSATLSGYVGNTLAALSNAMAINPNTLCASFSKNTVSVSVQSLPQAMPVTFLGLKARKDGKKVQLEWSTASEQNSAYFELQRSADGSNFTTAIGTLIAAGNSTTVKNYAVSDAQPLASWNYYRAKQVDKDGKVAYSNVAAINFEKAASVVIVYPNPAKDKLTVEYTATKAGLVTTQIVDSKGAVVLTNNSSVVVGRNNNTLNITALSNGVYVLRTMDAEGNINHVKFIKE